MFFLERKLLNQRLARNMLDWTHGGFSVETFARWRSKGLPSHATPPTFSCLSVGKDLFTHLGVTKFGYVLPGLDFDPPFAPVVLSEDGDTRVERIDRGVIQRVSTRGPSIPQFLEHPVKDRSDYERLRERLEPPGRQALPRGLEPAGRQHAGPGPYGCVHPHGRLLRLPACNHGTRGIPPDPARQPGALPRGGPRPGDLRRPA